MCELQLFLGFPLFFVPFSKDAEFWRQRCGVQPRVCEGERDKRGRLREKRDTAESGLFLQRKPPFRGEKKKSGKGYGRVCVCVRSPVDRLIISVDRFCCALLLTNVSQLKVVFRKSINQSCNVYLYGCGGWGGIKW